MKLNLQYFLHAYLSLSRPKSEFIFLDHAFQSKLDEAVDPVLVELTTDVDPGLRFEVVITTGFDPVPVFVVVDDDNILEITWFPVPVPDPVFEDVITTGLDPVSVADVFDTILIFDPPVPVVIVCVGTAGKLAFNCFAHAFQSNVANGFDAVFCVIRTLFAPVSVPELILVLTLEVEDTLEEPVFETTLFVLWYVVEPSGLWIMVCPFTNIPCKNDNVLFHKPMIINY